MKKSYLVCPRCGEISETPERWDVELRTFYTPRKIDDEFVLTISPWVMEQMVVKHACGFQTDQYPLDAFVVEVEGNKVVKVGWYWDDYTPLLAKIIETKGTGWVVDEL